MKNYKIKTIAKNEFNVTISDGAEFHICIGETYTGGYIAILNKRVCITTKKRNPDNFTHTDRWNIFNINQLRECAYGVCNYAEEIAQAVHDYIEFIEENKND